MSKADFEDRLQRIGANAQQHRPMVQDAGYAGPSRAYSASFAQPMRQASKGAQTFYSLLGFAFGAIACLYMFLAATALLIDTETARVFSSGGVLIAIVLALVSVLIGLTGLFVRGRALGRVPVYFVIGGFLAFAIIRIFRINMLEWTSFTAMLQ